MSTETIDIVVREQGSAQAAKNIAGMGDAADHTTKSVEGLNTASAFLKDTLAALGLTFGIAALVKQGDAYTNIINKLRLTTSSAKELVDVEQKLFDVSQNTRQSFEETTSLYTKLALQANRIGVEGKDLLDVIQTVNQAIQVSGISSVQASQGLLQLSQGLSAGVLQGQDLKAVLEDIPFLGQEIAKGLGVGTAELRKMGENGELTTKRVIEALQKIAPEVAKAAGSMQLTISQAFTKLENAVLRYIGQSDQATGTTRTLALIIAQLADHLNLVVTTIGIVTGAFIAYRSVLITVQAVTAAVAAATALLDAGLLPIVATAAAVVVALYGVYKVYTILKGTQDVIGLSAKNLGGAFLGLGKDAAVGAAGVGNAYKDMQARQKEFDKEDDEAFAAAQERRKAFKEANDKAFQGYMDDMQKAIDKEAELAKFTRNAFGDMIEVTSEWARRSGELFNAVKGSQDGFAKSMTATADTAVAQSNRIASAANAAADALKNLSYASVAAPDEGEFRRFAGTQGYDPDKLLRDINSAATLYGTPSGGAALQTVAGDLSGVPPAVLAYMKANFGYLFSRIEGGGYGKFKDGGDFTVGGGGGVDSQLVSFYATPGEQVSVRNPGQPGGGVTVQMTVVTKDADSFQRSQTQILTSLQGGLNSIARRL